MIIIRISDYEHNYEYTDVEFGLSLSYISDIGNSDSLQELVTDNLGEDGIFSDQVSG